jgi:hypothetical protein
VRWADPATLELTATTAARSCKELLNAHRSWALAQLDGETLLKQYYVYTRSSSSSSSSSRVFDNWPPRHSPTHQPLFFSNYQKCTSKLMPNEPLSSAQVEMPLR